MGGPFLVKGLVGCTKNHTLVRWQKSGAWCDLSVPSFSDIYQELVGLSVTQPKPSYLWAMSDK
jgi:hypothetical protein